MNEEKKDDLLTAFENPTTDPTPDIAPVMPESSNTVTPVEPVTPVTPVAPVINTDNMMAPEFQNAQEVTPIDVTPVAPVINTDSMMAPEFQNAQEATPIDVTPVVPVTPVASVEPQVASVETPVVPTAPATDTPDNTAMQNVPENVSVEPAVAVKQETSMAEEEPVFLKKNLKFLIIIAVLIAAFIILLPTILNLLGGIK